MTTSQTASIISRLRDGERPAISDLSRLDEPDVVIREALRTPNGRLWLRSLSDLSLEFALELLGFIDDFHTTRRDRTLTAVVDLVPMEALLAHADSLAQGSAATAFWSRLRKNRELLVETAASILAGDNIQAAETTVYLLVLDPIDPFEVGSAGRALIASQGLNSPAATVRSLAAEYLFDNDPAILAANFNALVHDNDERVRGLVWSAAIRFDTSNALEQAHHILADDCQPIGSRRSALAAIGTSFDTRDVVDLLADLVVHPNETIAVDAANLLYRLHRHPTIAMAAIASPHQHVREIGEFLLDPYRGSPAAGGSRPGDPTDSDMFARLIRETEDRVLDEDATD
jgi:hypothetical protein